MLQDEFRDFYVLRDIDGGKRRQGSIVATGIEKLGHSPPSDGTEFLQTSRQNHGRVPTMTSFLGQNGSSVGSLPVGKRNPNCITRFLPNLQPDSMAGLRPSSSLQPQRTLSSHTS
mmetsp:Transcript_13621/g.28649  ORF Transcript_13621/g.28649 Transcript_13621/m.28649 type:complete len:115 (-) Transcript_13621:671-1015(-)